MDVIALIVGAVIGLLLGIAAAAAHFISKRSALQSELENQRTRAQMLDEQRQSLVSDLEQVRRDLETTDRERDDAMRKLSAQDERIKAYENAEQRMKDTFHAVGAQALKTSTDEFLKIARQQFEQLLTSSKGDLDKRQQAIDSMVKPIRELLEQHRTAVTDLEKKRETAYTSLHEQIKYISDSHEKLNTQTSNLVAALRRPEQRGRWGEMQLRNAVEMAGMTAHCDFTEQPQTDDPETRDRPDMIVRLPGGGRIIVDSKVALDAYLDALQPDADREQLMKRHLEQISTHGRRLATKRYWDQFDHCPRLVVLFMPLESALSAALEVKPDLHSEFMQQHVLIATPTLLVALLRAVAYGWQQEALAENAREIADQGKALYDRLSTFVGHLEKVGKNLDRSVNSYNDAIGSLERMVLPASRKLKELHATTEDELEAPPAIEIETRDVTSGELKPSLLEAETDRNGQPL